MQPRDFFINFVGTQPLFVRENAARCLEVLEAADEYRPTHWRVGERAEAPYDRASLLARIPGGRKASQMSLFVTRKSAPSYEAFIGLGPFPAFRLGIREVLPPERRPAFFELGEVLGATLAPDYGTVSAFWTVGPQHKSPDEKTVYEHSRSALVTSGDYFQYGPWGMGLRTYLSERFVELAGREAMLRTPAHVTDWGRGLRVDLYEPPWEIGAEALAERYRRVMDHLRATGVFATRTRGIIKFRPGPRWQRLPPVDTAPIFVPTTPPRPRSEADVLAERLLSAIGCGEVVRDVDLSGLDLSGAELDELKVEEVTAKRVRLAGARLVRANLQLFDLEEADLEGASLADADIFQCRFHRARLRGARLAGANVFDSFMFDADLTGADLEGACIGGTFFDRASLREANLQAVRGKDPTFAKADLTRARLAGTRLEQAEFRDAVLRGADFSGANLVGCDLRGADLEGARWDGARLESCRFDPGAEPTS